MNASRKRKRANGKRLWYATLRLRPAYAETGGVARLRPLALAFWGLRPLRVLRPPRDAEARLLPLWSERPKRLRLRLPYWPALGLRVSQDSLATPTRVA